ncbi:MAG: endonuclease/exonuclease/phosphatase family protein [Gammaproteobacteria bacterium]|nr:endonuclease/exonuclease/phosphatase family protein [Gammaproteobacteria bacterium]
MLTARRFILLVLLSLLAACVSINDRVQLVSNALASSQQLQSCDLTSVENENKGQSHGLNPENIAFLNWNIYKGNRENWQRDLSAFAQGHDLMTIQEAMLDENLTALLEQHGFKWVMNEAFRLNGTAAGVMTAADADAVQSCGFKTDEPLIQIPKSTLISYYTINGSKKRLLVANIHGINFTLGLDTYHQQLEQLYDAIKHHDGPMIVAGDFNNWSEGRLKQVNELVEKLALSGIEYRVNNKTLFFGNAIDHVFYRQLELVSSRVWQVSSSDHNPISANFRFHEAVF